MSPIAIHTISPDAIAIFRDRPNRFVGLVDMIAPAGAQNVPVHVHDPGRLIDLLYPGNTVLLRKADSPARKTKWDLIAARHQDSFVLTHSGYHRTIADTIIRHPQILPFGPLAALDAEITYGHSRLDFRAIRPDGLPVWIEVKGCTMAENNIAMFPDAPTKRGTKHINTLLTIREHNLNAAIVFLVFRTEVGAFAPHAGIDPAFASTLQQAIDAGVQVLPFACAFENNLIVYKKMLPVVPYPG